MRISKAYIEITNRCNLNCTTCYNRSGLNTVTREIGVTELERMITTFMSYGAKRILISGGEPTLHSEFEKIAALPSRYPQLSFGVTTNGTTAAARSVLAPAIKSQENMTLQISLDGSSEETNALTRGRGNFEKAVEFARSVSDSPAEKRLKMVVSRGNLADVEKFYRLALSLGFTPEFAFIFRSGNGECEWDEKTLTPLEKLKVMKTVQRLNEESGANAQLPLCSLGCPLSLDDSELSLCVKTDGLDSALSGAVRRKIHRGKRAFLRRDGIRGGNAPGCAASPKPAPKAIIPAGAASCARSAARAAWRTRISSRETRSPTTADANSAKWRS